MAGEVGKGGKEGGEERGRRGARETVGPTRVKIQASVNKKRMALGNIHTDFEVRHAPHKHTQEGEAKQNQDGGA